VQRAFPDPAGGARDRRPSLHIGPGTGKLASRPPPMLLPQPFAGLRPALYPPPTPGFRCRPSRNSSLLRSRDAAGLRLATVLNVCSIWTRKSG